MSSAQSMFRFLIQSVGLGLVVAAIVVLMMPLISPQQNTLNPDSAPLSFNHAVDRAAPAVVNIYSLGEIEGSYYQPQTSRVWRLGSGVIMDSRGYILTAQHVVDNVDQILVALQDGRQYGAQLIGSDYYTDLAVLKIEADNLPVIPTADKPQPRVGDIVLAIGNPYNIGQTITQGIISATGGRVGVSRSSYSDLIQMDAVINQGASGGALVNTAGELIGINNARFNNAFGDGIEGIYFAVPYSNAREIMQTLIAEGKVVRGWIGISVDPNSSDQLAQQGIQVTAVEPGSPAAVAGMRQGDIITRIGGKPVRSASEGMREVVNAKPGSALDITIYRNGEPQQLTVTTAEPPSG
ncbi:serine protease DegS [Idiomarina aquatica]|uniref:Serine protease DegS n=1 Tax=Idiomarina aquatica TaxID=1327752 RepID=A0A4R6P5A1_9GAMM|nr:trypsin-like peptidase domain-containing protein [Idiomarina aquatica]TDP32711.1 serine protease DegS [Idiomarina aquatica]